MHALTCPCRIFLLSGVSLAPLIYQILPARPRKIAQRAAYSLKAGSSSAHTRSSGLNGGSRPQIR